MSNLIYVTYLQDFGLCLFFHLAHQMLKKHLSPSCQTESNTAKKASLSQGWLNNFAPGPVLDGDRRILSINKKCIVINASV